MPEEAFVEPKPTNWLRMILAAVLGFGLLAGAAYAGYWYRTQRPSEISKLNLKPDANTPAPSDNYRRSIHDFEGIPFEIFSPYGYQVFYKSDPNSLDTEMYVTKKIASAKSPTVETKVTKVLELKRFGGEFDNIVWSVDGEHKARFILSTHIGDTTAHFLVNIDGSPAITLDLPYFSEVLSWLDNGRILVKQTEIDLSNPESAGVVSYWVAPVSDLQNKVLINL